MGVTYIDIPLDRRRQLRFTINTFADIEQHFGKPLTQILHDMGLGTIRDLLWFGLRHEDRKLTAIRVGELIEDAIAAGTSLMVIMERLNEALEQSGVFAPPTTEDRGSEPARPPEP